MFYLYFRAQSVGRALIHVLQKAQSGSVWVAENNKSAKEVKFPNFWISAVCHQYIFFTIVGLVFFTFFNAHTNLWLCKNRYVFLFNPVTQSYNICIYYFIRWNHKSFTIDRYPSYYTHTYLTYYIHNTYIILFYNQYNILIGSFINHNVNVILATI